MLSGEIKKLDVPKEEAAKNTDYLSLIKSSIKRENSKITKGAVKFELQGNLKT